MKTVVTHSGKFHPDDVFAVACIQMLEGRENLNIVRTRDTEEIKKGDWVVDVGNVYDPESLRFDHHQPGAPVRENGVGYAAFGLVWKHCGEQIAGSKEVAKKIEEDLAVAIDAHDIGFTIYNRTELNIKPAEMFDVIYAFVPPWQSEDDIDEQFLKAVDFAYGHLDRVLKRAQAKQRMKEYAKELYETAEDKRVIMSEVGVSTSLYIECPDVEAVVSVNKDKPNSWIVSAIPTGDNPFEYRLRFPKEWGGLRDEELEHVSGIEGLEFCHKNMPFIVAHSKEAALKATEFLS